VCDAAAVDERTLGEDLLLLALDDEKGTISTPASDAVGYGLAGAALMDLTLQGRLEAGRGETLVVADPGPAGDDVLDEALQKIASSRKPGKAPHWGNPVPDQELRERVRSAVLEGGDVDARTAVLISLARACAVLDPLFTRHERREARDRIKSITEGELLGKAVRKTVAEVQAAIAGGILVVLSLTSSSSS
jgi:golgi phosphoprotein 3